MSQFDDFVRRITQDLDLPEKTKIAIREEALAHLEDEAARCIAEGMSPGDAERAAIDRFGKEDEMTKMVSQSLAATQARFKARRILLTVASMLVALTVWPLCRELYSWMSWRYGGPINGTQPQPAWIYYANLVMLIGMFVILFAIGMRLAGARILVAVTATAAMIAVGFVSVPLARITYSSMSGGPQVDASVTGEIILYSVWALAISALALALHRDRTQYLLAAACLINAVLAGYIHFLGITHPATYPYYHIYPYLRSSETPGAAFFGLQLVLFIWLLARGITLLCEKRGWLRRNQEPTTAT